MFTRRTTAATAHPALLAIGSMLLVAALAGCSSGKSGGSGGATPTKAFTPPPVATDKPSVAVTTLAPVPLGRTVTVTGGVRVKIGGLHRLTVTGSGPGETSGPAFSVVVQVINNGQKTINLGGFAVTATYGKSIPAVPASGKPSAPLNGALAAGKSASGIYVFRVPSNAKPLTVSVASDIAAGIAVFHS